MKKRIIIGIELLVIVSSFTYVAGMINSYNKTCKSYQNFQEKVVSEQVQDKYVDDNPTNINFYVKKVSSRDLINEYNGYWIQYKDILLISAFPYNDISLANKTIMDIWNEYLSLYPERSKYKIGYYIEFQLANGQVFKQTILKPDDVFPFFNYIQIYLYDDVHQTKGAWYSHVEQSSFNENTILSSIKLTASTYIDQVLSPIKLSVFTYDSEDDFVNNVYRGKSIKTININKM